MIYTTYFAKVKNLPETITPVSIARKSPDGWKGLTYTKLAPTKEILSDWKENKNSSNYMHQYSKQVLDKLHIDEVLAELYALANTADIALVCYEKPEDFCHRHFVADWFKESGFDAEEYVYE